MSPELLVEPRGAVLWLSLNRPEVLNALTGTMLAGLMSELKKAEKNPAVRCVVLTGKGRAFCSGADLADLRARQKGGQLSLGAELRNHFNPLILQIRRMEKPVIGAVNGLAAGAGASIILACDLKIALHHSSFIQAFVRVGLAPDSGMSFYMPRHLGLARALELAWTAKPLSAETALHCGLINKIVQSPEELEREAAALASELAKQPPLALALAKRALNRSFEHTLGEQLEYEAQLQDFLGQSKDHAEGVAAFLEKRPARFTGE